MKKILLTLLLMFTILIPVAQVSAADVPDFRQVAGNYVTDGERVNNRRKGYYSYAYNCPLDLRQNFAEQYINLLIRSGCSFVGHEANDWRRTSAQYLDKWYFRCRGQVVEFWQYQYFDQGRISFSVRVGYGLTYAGR